uniref:Uncharacterized protein n=1 Tax=Oryza sativa subsp. japonica TaxID=39947 RepID=Q6ZG14_ORYSJ|nr:hypothetical protein [Oryza sativa Japonica Group]
MQERADGNVRQHAHLRHPPVSTTLRPLACLVPLWQPLAGVAQRPEKPHTVVDGKEKEQGKGKAPALASRGCTRQVAAAAAQVKLALPPRCRHGARTRPARAELADASPTHAAAFPPPPANCCHIRPSLLRSHPAAALALHRSARRPFVKKDLRSTTARRPDLRARPPLASSPLILRRWQSCVASSRSTIAATEDADVGEARPENVTSEAVQPWCATRRRNSSAIGMTWPAKGLTMRMTCGGGGRCDDGGS